MPHSRIKRPTPGELFCPCCRASGFEETLGLIANANAIACICRRCTAVYARECTPDSPEESVFDSLAALRRRAEKQLEAQVEITNKLLAAMDAATRIADTSNRLLSERRKSREAAQSWDTTS